MKNILLFRFKIFLLVVGILLITGLSFAGKPGAEGSTISPDQCCSCHFDVCEKKASKRYVHAPVLENHCAVCHVKGGDLNIEQQAVDNKAQAEIEWFARDCQENDEHWFELPGSLAGKNISLMAKAGERKVLEQEVNLPLLEELEQFPVAQSGVHIYDLQVVEVKRGVFLSARIAWKTDRISDAQVFYGEKSLKAKSALDHRWATDHEITLTGLDSRRKYTFIAVSHDIYGNKALSEKMDFSTYDFFSEPALQSRVVQREIDLQARFYREKERLFARFATSQPVAMRLGRNGDEILMVREVGSKDKRPLEHLELTAPYSLSIAVCVGCHPQAKGAHSHPVDIRPKAGMHIPPDYRVMADGRLSCMSCHQAHASDNEYRLTRAKRKDLCLGCHRNFG